jgi:hypothetical protein
LELVEGNAEAVFLSVAIDFGNPQEATDFGIA